MPCHNSNQNTKEVDRQIKHMIYTLEVASRQADDSGVARAKESLKSIYGMEACVNAVRLWSETCLIGTGLCLLPG